MQKLRTCALLACLSLTTIFSFAQTGAPIRELATTNYYPDSLGWYSFDSTYYLYSGSRGGFPIVSDGFWEYAGKFDTSYYLSKGARLSDYHQSGRNIETFDSHDIMLSSVSQAYDTASHSWANEYQEIFTYDAHNNMLTHLSQTWNKASSAWQNQARNGNTYDASNNMLTDTLASWVSGTWQYTSLTQFTYDTHNNLTDQVQMTYLSGNWNNAAKYSYFLNAGFKPDSVVSYSPSGSGWAGSLKDVYTYDGVYNNLTDTSFLWSGTAYASRSLDIYTYSGSDQLSDEHKIPLGTTGWQNNYYIANTYDGHHNQVRQVKQVWNTVAMAYINSTSSDNSFNTDNKLDTMTLSGWKSSSSVWNATYRSVNYYSPTTAVKNVNQMAGDMHIYPSPANGNMNVDINWKTAQRATLAIYDMNGRLYRQWTDNPGLSYHSNIPTESMPAGNYILKVRGDAGQMAEQFSIVH